MRILVAGANGLVGQGVVAACLASPEVTEVGQLVRRPTGRNAPRLTDLVCPDFADLAGVEARLAGFDACLYCAGAPPVGTPEPTYRQVTLTLTSHVAGVLARVNPGVRFLYVSGAGADPHSRWMPMRIKGETERALASLPITTVMLRPGGIQPVGGVHSPHPGMARMYRVVGPLMGLAVPLLPGLLTRTDRLGRAMLRLAMQADPPPVVDNRAINRLGA